MLYPELPVGLGWFLLWPAPCVWEPPAQSSSCSVTMKLTEHTPLAHAGSWLCSDQPSHQPDQITTSLEDQQPNSYQVYHTRPSQVRHPPFTDTRPVQAQPHVAGPAACPWLHTAAERPWLRWGVWSPPFPSYFELRILLSGHSLLVPFVCLCRILYFM